MNYWLIKSEGSCYSIDDLKHDGQTAWEGVRNYQARNSMKEMEVGDGLLFYHSSGSAAEPSGVYGIARVVGSAHVDESQFNKKDEHFDPKATKDKPIWYCVDVAFVEKLARPISLDEIKLDPKLAGMPVASPRFSRLSVQSVSEKHFTLVREMAKK